jgi:hypothetical protein
MATGHFRPHAKLAMDKIKAFLRVFEVCELFLQQLFVDMLPLENKLEISGTL